MTIPLINFINSSGGVPANTVAPAITGTEIDGQTLSVTNGTWTNSPTSYTYQWFRLVTYGGVAVTDNGLLVGIAIVGATSNTYVLTPDDVHEYIFCEVTATNGFGSAMQQSNVVGGVFGIGYLPYGLLTVDMEEPIVTGYLPYGLLSTRMS